MKRVKTGDRFGRLSVVKELKERSKDGHVVYMSVNVIVAIL